MTIKEKLIEAILARGETEVQTRAHNYQVFTRKFVRNKETGELLRSQAVGDFFYIVTRGGSLRLNNRPTRNGSIGAKILSQQLQDEVK